MEAEADMKALSTPSAGSEQEGCIDYSYGIMRKPGKKIAERSRDLETKRLDRRCSLAGAACLLGVHHHNSLWLRPPPSKHSIMI